MEVVSFEIAKKLKEKGFNYECFGHYFDSEFYTDMPPKYYQREKYVSAPTISQVLKWLREKKKMHIMINFWPAGYSAEIFTEIGKDKDSFCWERYIDECDYYDSYELAAIAGVEYCLDNLI
jgi:hypothetical protein